MQSTGKLTKTQKTETLKFSFSFFPPLLPLHLNIDPQQQCQQFVHYRLFLNVQTEMSYNSIMKPSNTFL